MSHNIENELAFLPAEFKNKLNKITVEMSKFIVLSTFRNLEANWCATDAKAKIAVNTVFSMKGRQICHLIKQMLGGGLVLTPDQKKSVLKYLYARTELIRSGMTLDNCSTTFFEIIFDKYLGGEGEPKTNNKRPREEGNARARVPLKRIKPNEINKSRKSITVIAFMPTVGMMPTNGYNMPFPYGKISCTAQHGNPQYRRPHFGQALYGGLIRSVASHTVIYPQPRAQAEIPRETVIPSSGNIAPPQPPNKPVEPIALKVFKKEEKKEIKMEIKKETPSASTEVVVFAPMKKEKKFAQPQPPKETRAEPIDVKLCKKEEKKEIKMEFKKEMPSTSNGGAEPGAIKEEKTEPSHGESKKNLLEPIRRRELFGKDDDDPDVEITGSYTVAIPLPLVRNDFR